MCKYCEMEILSNEAKRNIRKNQRVTIKIVRNKKTIPKMSNAIDTVLSLIKEQDKKIEHLKENIDYKTLCDFLMSSVSDEEEPIWTEKHIEELLDNFEVRWKDAHK